MLLHEGGTVNGGCDVCERMAREQELAKKKAIEEAQKQELAEKKAREELEQKEQELIQKMNEEITDSPESTKNMDLFSESSGSNVNQGDVNNVDPNSVLNNLSQSMTGRSLILGGVTTLGCVVGELSPEPISKSLGFGVCLIGSVATAGTALTGHALEPKERTKKP